MIGVVTEVTFECEEAHNLRENITIFPVEHCLQNLPHFSTQSDHGKFWIEAHSDVCASFSVWKTTQPVTEEQGVQLWDIKVYYTVEPPNKGHNRKGQPPKREDNLSMKDKMPVVPML